MCLDLRGFEYRELKIEDGGRLYHAVGDRLSGLAASPRVYGYDAIEFLLAGAKAVQVGAVAFTNPLATLEIIDDVATYIEKKEIFCIKDLSIRQFPYII
jgi:hypothetical protein